MLDLSTITANEISKCLRCRDFFTKQVYYDVRIDEKISFTVRQNGDFGFYL